MVMVEKEDIRKTSCPRLNNKEFLDVLAGGALGHAVPGCVAQGAADGPHDGDGDFSGAWREEDVSNFGRERGVMDVVGKTYLGARPGQPSPSCERRCSRSWKSCTGWWLEQRACQPRRRQ